MGARTIPRTVPAARVGAREYRESVDRRVDGLARTAGFPARTRGDRVRDEAPPRSRQLSLVW